MLNSHRRFFLSYVAPVLWNAAIIAALVLEGRSTPRGLPAGHRGGLGAVAGSLLQLMFQLPVVLVLLRGLRVSLGRGSSHVRTVWPQLRARGPRSRGGADRRLRGRLHRQLPADRRDGRAQLRADAVPASRSACSAWPFPRPSCPRWRAPAGTRDAIAAMLRDRLATSLRRMAFFVVPSAVAFLALGEVVVALVYRTGRFGASETRFVWTILAGFSTGPAPPRRRGSTHRRSTPSAT